MLCYCLRCRKNTESENPEVVKTKNGRIKLLSKCSVCNSIKLKFIKGQEARGVLSNFDGTKNTISTWFTHGKYFTLKV